MVQRNVLLVHNTNEGSIFIPPTYSGDAETYITQLLPTISSENAKRAANMYKGHGNAIAQAAKVYGECGCRESSVSTPV